MQKSLRVTAECLMPLVLAQNERTIGFVLFTSAAARGSPEDRPWPWLSEIATRFTASLFGIMSIRVLLTVLR